MKKTTILFITIILILGFRFKKNDYKDANLPVDERVRLLLQQMTQQEKVAQLFTASAAQEIGDDKDDQHRFNIDSERVQLKNGCGFIFIGHATANMEAFTKRINQLQSYFVNETRLGIPAIFGGEGLHGFVANGATSFPQDIALGGTFDTALIEKAYSVIGREMRSRGISQVFGPNIDLGREPRFGRVEETYSEDPYLTAQMGLAAVRGLQGRTLGELKDDHVAATLKHFAGHGEPMGGRNTAPIGNVNTIGFHENHLLPFETCVKEGHALSVMASYNDADGVPNHANKLLLTDILKTGYGFDGYVMGDCGGVSRMVEVQKAYNTEKEAAQYSFNAGLDMELVWDKPIFSTLGELVKEGKVSQQRLDDAVGRILRLKFLLGLFEHPYADVGKVAQQTHTAQDKSLALEAAEKSAVLLKNEHVLPLNAAKIKQLAVIGPMAATVHLGGYAYEPFAGVSILKGLQDFSKGKFVVNYAEGCKISTKPATSWDSQNPVPNSAESDKKLIAEAVKTASSADVIILVIGEHESFAREARGNIRGDRDDLGLPGMQNELVEALLKTGKPIVAIITGGRPLAFERVAEKIPAIFQAWYLGEAAGTAMANLLFGATNPSGKLAISIPRNVGQLPVYYNHYPSLNIQYLLSNSEPLYVFGDGLSYTSFQYSNLRLSDTVFTGKNNVELKVDIKNTGKVAGDEVAQFYISQDGCGVVRPVIQLKDFRRIHLLPGESKTVVFSINNDKFSFFDQSLKRVLAPGTVVLKVGADTKKLQQISLKIKP